MNQPHPLISKRELKAYAGLTRRKGRAEHGLFLVEGVRSVESAVRAGTKLKALLVSEGEVARDRIQRIAEQASCKMAVLPARDLAALSDVQSSQGIVAVASSVVKSDVGELSGAQRVVLLDGVQDPGNVGTLIRTAAWFGVDAVVSDNSSADFESPKVVRSSMGGFWDVELVRLPNLLEAIELLQSRGLEVVGADLGGEQLADWAPSAEGALVLGSEAHGISQAVSAKLNSRITIPANANIASAGVESLNVVVAGGILLQHWLG